MFEREARHATEPGTSAAGQERARLRSKSAADWLSAVLAGRRGAVAIPILIAALLVVFPWISGHDQYWIRQISLIAVFGLVVSGVNLSLGYAGEVQFGQVFMFAVGAYLTAAIANAAVTAELIPLLLVGGLAAAIVGMLIAIPAVRVGGWSLAMASFFLVITFPDFSQLLQKYTGGDQGQSVAMPELFGVPLGAEGLYVVTVVVLILWFAIYRNLVRSRYGVIFRTLRESPVLTGSLGFSPRRLKVLAYTLGAFPAGVGGCLYGFLYQFLSPDAFSLSVAIGIVAASVLGGVESIYGALVGAAVLQLGPMNSLTFEKYSTVAYGVFLIVAAIVFRRGLGGVGTLVAQRLSGLVARAGSGAAAESESTQPSVSAASLGRRDGAQLEVDAVAKAYAGVKALQGVTLSARPGEVTALIGSNGSGKTTLLNVICGYARPDRGSVTYRGERLTGMAPFRVALAGVGRTFQTPTIPRGISVLEAVASGRYVVDQAGVASSVLRLPRHWRARTSDRRHALEALELVGLRDLAEDEAGTLPLGTRRLVEVARSLCGDTSLLLLDEPASGLADHEVHKLREIIRIVADAGGTVMLIEHNFGFVASVSDTAYVLHFGRLLASGPAATIGEDERVIESYLGAQADRSNDARPRVVSAEGLPTSTS